MDSFPALMPSMDTVSWKDALTKALEEDLEENPQLWVKSEEVMSDSVNLPAVRRFQASDKYY